MAALPGHISNLVHGSWAGVDGRAHGRPQRVGGDLIRKPLTSSVVLFHGWRLHKRRRDVASENRRGTPLTERLTAALNRHRHLRCSRLLCKDDGRSLTRQSAWGRVRRAARRASVPTSVHILRHTFCSHLAMRGAPGQGNPGTGSSMQRKSRYRFQPLVLLRDRDDNLSASMTGFDVAQGRRRLL